VDRHWTAGLPRARAADVVYMGRPALAALHECRDTGRRLNVSVKNAAAVNARFWIVSVTVSKTILAKNLSAQ